VTALAPYEGNVRRAVLALKNGRRDVARALAERLCALVTPEETLVPVPTTKARRRERGFDGCELIANLIAQRTGACVEAHLVQIAGDRQRGRGRDARLSARGRFAWRGTPLEGRRVTLLDDVVTTGATLEDCAAELRRAGATIEKAIVIARA
jgi:predicted amidophosphoribosyltransferase